MAELRTYSKAVTGWRWTGINTLNQAWSYIYVPESIIVDNIKIHWGGYDRSTSGRHFIAKATSRTSGSIGAIVARSSIINVPMGRAWRSTNITPVTLEPGHYVVGIWGDPKGRRVYSEWDGASGGGTTIYEKTMISGISGNITGSKYEKWVLPCILNYTPAGGKVNIRLGNGWNKGQVYVRLGNGWNKAKAVYVRLGNGWNKAK